MEIGVRLQPLYPNSKVSCNPEGIGRLTTRSTGPPVRAFYLAVVGGGGPVNLVLLGGMETIAIAATIVVVAIALVTTRSGKIGQLGLSRRRALAERQFRSLRVNSDDLRLIFDGATATVVLGRVGPSASSTARVSCSPFQFQSRPRDTVALD